MKQNRNLSFYIEIVVMLVISVMVITITATAFASSDMHSREAKKLSDAVTLAASGAECFLAADDIDELCSILNEAENVTAASENGAYSEVTAYYNSDLLPARDGEFQMKISWDDKDGFVTGTVTVSCDGTEIYSLETGAQKGAESQAARAGTGEGAGR